MEYERIFSGFKVDGGGSKYENFKVQNAEQRSLSSKTPPFGLRREGGRDVPICQYKIMRISAKPLFGRKITFAATAGGIKSL